jgi:Family of unknown function (DUF6492)
MAHKLAIAIVTFRRDIDAFVSLLESIQKHNAENVPVVAICPELDIRVFRQISSQVIFVPENAIITEHVSVRGFRAGYISQQRIKLNLFRLGLADNYLVVDSDSRFIRDFTYDDFFNEQGDLYSILTQDKELQADPHYQAYSDSRMIEISKIYNRFDVQDRRRLQVQMNPLLSSRVLELLVCEELPKLGLTDILALKISPFEYSWYTVCLIKSSIIPIIPIEPLFYTFHTRGQFISALSRGLDEVLLSKSFLGVIYNSNWFAEYQKIPPIRRYFENLRYDQYFSSPLRKLINVRQKKG